MSENIIADTLRDKVKLKVGIIGNGNAGSQLVDCAYKNGFTNVFAVNSSSKDMDNDVLNANINCFLIGNDGRGAGMNRDAAKELFKMNFRQLFDNMRFKQICDDSDVIFVGASCSGGTGSAISPVITKALKQLYPGKIVVFYGILPRLTASDVELSNSAACISEIGGRTADIVDISLEVRLFDQKLCFSDDRLLASCRNKSALMKCNRTKIARTEAATVVSDRKLDLLNRRNTARFFINRVICPLIRQ